jgi:hypothetical protein
MAVRQQTEFEALAGMCATPKCGETRLVDSDETYVSDYCLHCIEQPLGLHLVENEKKNHAEDEEVAMIMRVGASMKRMRVSDSRAGHRSEDEIDVRRANNNERAKIRDLAERCDVEQLHKQAKEMPSKMEEFDTLFDELVAVTSEVK